ncbi:MAG: CDP-alcohol phosphatidyltransferase family protein [Marinobacter sp.]|nr:CDP-alcohol phosphatidyltransferase family protein [Marinobacter sp.]
MSETHGAYLVRLNGADWVTLSGVISSLLAALASLHGQLYLAVSLLFLAMLGDALDGIIARRMGITRAFGRYLDSFMDVLIYLAVPSLVFYQAGFNGAWALVLAVVMACGCVRLAVFNELGNIAEGGQLAYLGLPVFWTQFILAGYLLASIWLPQLLLNVLLLSLLLWFSHAMVRRQPRFKFRKLWHILALTLGGAALFLILHLTLGHGGY